MENFQSLCYLCHRAQDILHIVMNKTDGSDELGDILKNLGYDLSWVDDNRTAQICSDCARCVRKTQQFLNNSRKNLNAIQNQIIPDNPDTNETPRDNLIHVDDNEDRTHHTYHNLPEESGVKVDGEQFIDFHVANDEESQKDIEEWRILQVTGGEQHASYENEEISPIEENLVIGELVISDDDEMVTREEIVEAVDEVIADDDNIEIEEMNLFPNVVGVEVVVDMDGMTDDESFYYQQIKNIIEALNNVIEDSDSDDEFSQLNAIDMVMNLGQASNREE